MSSGRQTAFALFDSGLNELRLPILRPVSSEMTVAEAGPATAGTRREFVAALVQRYFEWTGDAEEGTYYMSCNFRKSTNDVRKL